MKKYLIKVNGNQYEVEVEEVLAAGSAASAPAAPVAPAAPAAPVAAKPAAPAAAPAQTAAAQPAAATASAPAGATKINAPMPGTILRVAVNPGDTVKKNQVLLILEAMKMENEIVATKEGTIASIHVTKGSSVNAGDLMISIA